MPVSVVRATAADFLAIAGLDRQAWQSNRHPEFIPDGEHVWRIWCEHALVFCARDGATVAGAVLAFPCESAGPWCLHKVFVADACRGAGIGSELIASLLAELDRRGADCFLTVDPVNEHAIRVYRRWGFGEERLVRGFYRPEEDRLVLTRRAARPA